MKKQSLVISDKEKYGELADSLSTKKPKDRKSCPTISLKGPQVEAFGLDNPKVGDKFTATIHGVVKSSSCGDTYSDSLPDANSKKCEVTLCCTHCSATDEGAGGGEDDGSPEDEKDEGAEPAEGADADKESPADDEAAEEEDDSADEATAGDNGQGEEDGAAAPAKGKAKSGIGYKKKPVSVSESGLED